MSETIEIPTTFRPGALTNPHERLTSEQVELLHKASMDILNDPGIWCHNKKAADLFAANGAQVDEEDGVWRVRVPEKMVMDAVDSAPSQVVMGARNPDNSLVLDASVPRVYFGSGSETNVWVEAEMEKLQSVEDPERKIRGVRFRKKRGNAALLCRAARLADKLENLDFFIRPVNVQDEGITTHNHDVNKFFASLNNITKHVQAGLTDMEGLEPVIRMAEIIAGGPEELKKNPVISFIACVVKSPLQMVSDTSEKVLAIAEKGLPLVISSSPQGGSSAPIQEAGMVAQINAEILSGITLAQLVRKGTPVLYGSVPVRARLDDLHDLYGCAEFVHYGTDCVQMARHYGIPCYSSAGVGDAKVPGIQATFEKLLTHLSVGMSGAQYIHYAFGLLDRTNSFCPLQAVLDNEQLGAVKSCLRRPRIDEASVEEVLGIIRKVMKTSHRLFARHTRSAQHAGEISDPYAFESKGMRDRVLVKAKEHLDKLESEPSNPLPEDIIDQIYSEVPGILPQLREV